MFHHSSPRHGKELLRTCPSGRFVETVSLMRLKTKGRPYGKTQSPGTQAIELKKEIDQMRIAIPTDDGASISGHFGRSAAFLIFETEDGRITGRSTRTNHAKHTQGSCGQHSAGSQAHSHTGILSALEGCEVVICAGMGSRAAEALKAGGVREIVVTTPGLVEETVLAFLSGTLTGQAKDFCACHH